MKIVKIIWRDSNRYLYDMDINDYVDVKTIITAGFLVSKDKDKVVVAQDSIPDDIEDHIEGHTRGVIVIPKENIISIKILKG